MKAIIHRGQQYGALNGVYTKNSEVMKAVVAAMKLGAAKLLIDTPQTLMYELKQTAKP